MNAYETSSTNSPEILGGGITFLTTLAEAESCEVLLPYLRIIRSAWNDFDLSSIYCVDNIPTIYLKEVAAPLSSEELNQVHRRFWNQGVAQTLIVVDPKTVRIFSGLAAPQQNEIPLTVESPSIVKVLPVLDFKHKAASIFQAIANGQWYIQHSEKYKSTRGVDSYLLNNLVGLHNDLMQADENGERLSTQAANSLIGRVLFVCYLVDREIVTLPAPFAGLKLHEALKQLKSNSEAITFLYAFFEQLKEDFNGSMFDQNLAIEKDLIKPFHFQQIRHFLDGHEVGSPQYSLGFWAYDFRLIPVETISAIYEEFLAHEDPDQKKATGAFYTPRFLAEMAIDVAIEGRSDWQKFRYLDPCCGSGIFLVTIFNRIANKWLLDNPNCNDYLTKVEALKNILKENIRGVDLNLTACRLACFSLYIAFLDSLSPSDIKTYVFFTKHKLPHLLAGAETTVGAESIPVVTHADFLENGVPETAFDCIVGNPPWEGRSSKQLALKIMDQAERCLKDNGECCLLLPSKVFLNATTNAFQANWLKRVTVERVVQLADYRFILFEKALCPAMIVRYRKQPQSDPAHRIAYDTPKFHPSARRRGLITICSQDHKWLSQNHVQLGALEKSAPTIWKRSMWGTNRDIRLLEYLRTFPILNNITGEPQEGKRWVKGQGFQPNTSGKSKKPKEPWWTKYDLYISARAKSLSFSNVLLENDCEVIGDRFKTLRRTPNPRIYKAPLILVSQGFKKIVYCSFDVLFQHSLQSISALPEDKNLLLFLTLYLRSSLAKFYLFHTAANWGTERDKVHLDELLMLPFPLPEDSPVENAADIVKKVAERMDQEREEQEQLYGKCLERYRKLDGPDEQRARKEWLKQRKERTEAVQKELEPLIYRYFGLLEPEIMLLQDTVNISIPSSTPSEAKASRFDLQTLQSIAFCKVKGYERGLAVYAETLAETLNTWAKDRGSNFRVRPYGGVDKESGVAMVTLNLGNESGPMVELEISQSFSRILKQGLEASVRQTPTIRSERELIWFEGERVHVIRSAKLNHWTRTAALNDADALFGEIAMARRLTNV